MWIPQTVGWTPWTRYRPVARPLPIQDNINTEGGQTFIPRVGFETTIPMFERKKIFYALDCAATVIRKNKLNELKLTSLWRAAKEKITCIKKYMTEILK
jgi:hypothetical protein